MLLQAWMEERLDYMGFEARPFPQLVPLTLHLEDASSSQSNSSSVGDDATSSSTGGADGSNGRDDGGSSSRVQGTAGVLRRPAGSPVRTFARWARKGKELPLLASQWHKVRR